MSGTTPEALRPGAVIGILGGGQLGRMTAQAATALGYRSHIFCPEAGAPAAQATPLATRADYTDEAALRDFAKAVEVVTYEFENVAFSAAETLARYVPVYPGPSVLHIC